MSKQLHPDNQAKTDAVLIADAVAAMLAATDRHFKNNGATGPTIRACIPAQADDTDVIVMDALGRAEDVIKQRDALLLALREIDTMSVFTLDDNAYVLIGQMGSVARKAIQQETKL